MASVDHPLTSDPIADRARRLFGDVPCRVQVAALPWRRTTAGIEIMLITSRDTGRWVLPKGWPEKKELFCEAAAREAVEEAGLKGAVAKHEAGRYFYAKAKSSGEGIPCEVLVFPLEVDGVAKRWKEKGERTRKWVSGTEAAGMINEPDLGELIKTFCAQMHRSAA